MRTLLLTCLMLLYGCATLTPPAVDEAASTPEAALAAYQQVLTRYVNDRGEVDFPLLQAQRQPLDRYVDFIARTPASVFTDPKARLAHYLNSYNALSMFNVLELGIPETHAGLRKVHAFFLRRFLIGGEAMSLYSYENNIIRKLKDPRVHFALNCSARACPRLPQVAFSAANVDRELDREARFFFSEVRNLRVDKERHALQLSEILKFYTEDFVPTQASNLIAYVNRYVDSPLPEDYSVEFIPYDWTIANTRTAVASMP